MISEIMFSEGKCGLQAVAPRWSLPAQLYNHNYKRPFFSSSNLKVVLALLASQLPNGFAHWHKAQTTAYHKKKLRSVMSVNMFQIWSECIGCLHLTQPCHSKSWSISQITDDLLPLQTTSQSTPACLWKLVYEKGSRQCGISKSFKV